jgi:hypothetical protein
VDRKVIDPDWQPNAADLAWAAKACPKLNVAIFTQRFVLSCQAKGYRYADYNAAWRRWVSEPKSPLPLIRHQTQPTIQSGESDHDVFRASLNDEGSSFGGERKTFSPGGSGRSFGNVSGLKAANTSRAHDVLERLLGRRADGPLAEAAGRA